MSKIIFILIFSLIFISYLFAGALTGIKLCIDPGHGGTASGAVGLNGLKEADIVLIVSHELKKLLTGAGASVYMTRTEDVSLSLGGRTSFANSLNVDRFVSVHFNAASVRSANYSGCHVYTSASQNSIKLASATITEIKKTLQLRLVSTNCSVTGVHKDNFYVVKNTSMPAELTESSFISNVDEEQRLRNADYLNGIAQAHYYGILTHFGKPIPDDLQPPVISHTPQTESFTNEDISISTDVTDDKGIKKVYLYYRNINDPNFSVKDMNSGSGNNYTAVIASTFTKIGKIEYYIKAIDTSSSANAAVSPSSSPSSNHLITINEIPATGKLIGIISDNESDKRLASAKCVLSPLNKETYTSSTGVYSFYNIPAGNYTVTVSLTGYQTASKSKTVQLDQTSWNSMELSKGTNDFKGKVIISEIMWAGKEYIELHNLTSNTIDISNWRVVNKGGKEVVLNDNAKIYKKSFYLIAESGAFSDLTPNEEKSLTFYNSDDVIKLYSGSISSTNLVDEVDCSGGWFGGNTSDEGHSMAVKDLTASNDDSDNWITSDVLFSGRYGTPGTDNTVAQSQSSSSYNAPSAIMTITGPTNIQVGSTYKYKAEIFSKTGTLLKSFEFDHHFASTDDLSVVKTAAVNDGSKLIQVTGILSVAVKDYGTVEAYFNDPPSKSTLLEDKLVELIAEAKNSLDIAAYSIKSYSVANALKNAANSIGANNIRIVTEGDYFKDPKCQAYYDIVKNAGITILPDSLEDGTTGYSHNKFAVIDKKKVLTGSYNFTYSGARYNNNNILVIESQKVAEQFTIEFEEMFVEQKFGPNKTDNTAHRVTFTENSSNKVNINKATIKELDTLPGIGPTTAQKIIDYRNANGGFTKIEDITNVGGIGSTTFNNIKDFISIEDGTGSDAGVDVEIYFSPSDNASYYMRTEIIKAQNSINFCIFAFTDKSIAQELVNAASRGVKVKGIFDSYQNENEFSKFTMLQNAGIDVALANGEGLLHHKFMVIDNSTVLTGSFNWTNAGDNLNDENLIIVHSPEIAQQYSSEFEKLAPSDKTNINTASKSELDALPSIGPTTAQKIIDHRTLHGSFQKIEDITNVSGIGSTTFNNIKDLISV